MSVNYRKPNSRSSLSRPRSERVRPTTRYDWNICLKPQNEIACIVFYPAAVINLCTYVCFACCYGVMSCLRRHEDHEIIISLSTVCVCLCVQTLQQRLKEMESELRSVRDTACGQERTIQTLSDSLNTKDCEVCLSRKVVTRILCIPHSLENNISKSLYNP